MPENVTITLPKQMAEWIVAILKDHPYTGAPEIVKTIQDQLADD